MTDSQEHTVGEQQRNCRSTRECRWSAWGTRLGGHVVGLAACIRLIRRGRHPALGGAGRAVGGAGAQ